MVQEQHPLNKSQVHNHPNVFNFTLHTFTNHAYMLILKGIADNCLVAISVSEV